MIAGAALAAGWLAVGLALGAALPAAPRAPLAPPADDGPTIDLTADNWGEHLALTDPGHPVYAHLFSRSSLTTVTATIHFAAPRPDGFTATLQDFQSFDGIQPGPCIVDDAPRTTAICRFGVAVSSGLNVLQVTLALPGSTVPIIARGGIVGGALQFSAGIETMDAAGRWQRIPDGGALELSSRQVTSVRLVLRNSGGLPFRATGFCDGGTIAPGTTRTCPLAGPRPVATLADTYAAQLRLEDPLGELGRTSTTATLAATSASFRLPSTSVVAGRPAILDVTDLPSGPFGPTDLGAFSLRLGDATVPADVVAPGRLQLSIPDVAPGSSSLDALLAGVTIARLPITVTARPEPATPPPPPTALIVIAAVGGAALALLLWRGIAVSRGLSRRSRAPRPSHPYRSASRASSAAAAGRPR